MQLILETEASVDLKTKMSLTDDVEKVVSDILTVQNGDIPNGDATTENNETAEAKDNDGVQNVDQIKAASIETDNDFQQNGDTVTSENNISNDCNATDILNGHNSPNEELHSENGNKCEDAASEDNHIDHDSKSNETAVNCDGAANDQNEDMGESHINTVEPVATLCHNTETGVTNVAASHNDDINENSNPSLIENIKHEITENTESVTDESSSKIDLNVDVNIKKEDEDTLIREDVNADACEDSLIKKETEENTIQENNSVLNTVSHKTTDESAQAESDDSNIKLSVVKTEITDSASENKETVVADNESAHEEKETMETDNAKDDASEENSKSIIVEASNNCASENKETVVTDNEPAHEEIETVEADNAKDDVSEENVESISVEASNNCDKVNDADISDEASKEELSTDNLNTSDVTSMDVDVNITAIHNDTTPVSVTDITESKVEENVTQIDDNKNCDNVIVNLDDDKETTTEQEKVETDSPLTKADNDEPVLNQDDQSKVTKHIEKMPNDDQMLVDDIIDLDEPKESQDSKTTDEESKNEKDTIDKTESENDKPIEPVLKLSNTLNILSDDEEEQVPKSTNTEVIENSDNKCINIEDDDDIMLIDDDTSGNEKIEPTKEPEVEKHTETKPASPAESEKVSEDNKIIHKVEEDVEKDAPVPEKEVIISTTSPDISEKTGENKFETEIKKPLIPENFLKTCKKNLVDMTRDELEEFCVLKIVESVLDRSSLSEVKNKLKTLTQNLEEYKKKAMMLQKQNRDLQVVFKSVQEDVKKATDAPIVPLKITRSVGMQVLMSEKTDKRRRPGPTGGMPNNFVNSNNKQVRNPVAQGPRPQKAPTQPIPVPRLVPASPAKTPQQVNTSKVTSPLPNGVKSVSPVQKGEKRTHNRMQSVTVDLTDDEPPTKMVNRTGPMPPVRLVPSQNLLATPRTPTVNSPRKVYIPISGPQGQNVRPGQTIMLKTVQSPGPRQRAAPPHMVRMPHGAMRMTRPQGLRHPAPLPECMKQYQPPNWKALPPAPDLKLAKVENGIVISWKIEGYQEDSYEEIASYQLYAYQETTSPPSTALWKKIGDVKALPLPMACTLTQFMAGYKYYFAVRAVDIRSRLGPFSLPGSILLLNKM
ncbi:activating transcription factor 7-interacting protein 1 [Leguminivora glycinivorella]|uniref:activating transcription factor 7-interacting protein 1 n=1 Tax=Leguminivora glycinivorella TaxID=1035111 RepID=UPI00200DEA03|nr:activating transcription factor 7-interacting protein 1 [Leguminivora glycinivorella]XP_047993390.1 activating transcription factor 7-interacting protein 1 [Leguminivora glycinivorella]